MGRRAILPLVLIIVIVLLLAGGAAAWLVYGDAARPSVSTDVIVPDGSSVSDIARLLQSDGVIRNASLLTLYVRLHGGGEHIQAAEYIFPAHATVAQALAVLEKGGRPPTVWLTIPEGYTASQIGHKLESAGLASEASFVRAVHARRIVLGGVATAGLEGYLFPDTYEVPRRASADDVVDLMTRQFIAKLPRDYLTAARRLRLNVPQIVTIASMIEREAKVEVERPLIASVIYNRLRLKMPLEIDATIEYALPHHKAALSYADLAIDSPYNTYAHAGLPPTPISNPGKASIDAAFHPATTPYLYYVYKGGGHHAFSETLEQQKENERRYIR